MTDSGPRSEPSSEAAALERLLGGVESAVRARLLQALAPVRAVEAALLEYRRAVEAQVLAVYASEHRLPAPPAPDPAPSARVLLERVRALGHLAQESPVSAPATTRPPAPQAEVSAPAPEALPSDPTWQALSERIARAPLVVVGGVTHLERLDFVPRSIVERVEWIDTTRQGTHAIGNLAGRIRGGRVCALVLLEGAVGHRHSEPLVFAARDAQVPVAFAGKGGRAALLRAFAQVTAKFTQL